uniref:Uncharacterized protein n=1 Tax=Cucumis melo TaxID=3656 RepID=A0A9I9EHR8_CUCME
MASRRGGIPAMGDNREQEEVEEIATLSPRTSTIRLPAVGDSLGDLHEKFDRMMDSLENAFKVELPPDLPIHQVFTVADLKHHHAPDNFKLAN